MDSKERYIPKFWELNQVNTNSIFTKFKFKLSTFRTLFSLFVVDHGKVLSLLSITFTLSLSSFSLKLAFSSFLRRLTEATDIETYL